MDRRNAMALCLTGILAPVMASSTAFADQADYPNRPIKLIVPFPPGGVVDPIARLWAERMGPLLGSIFIDNISGAGGTVGTSEAARAEPDGYTAVLGLTGTLVLNPVMMSRVSYNPIKDFAPVSILAISADGIAINPSIPATNLQEFISYAKKNGSKLTCGSAGVATMTNLVGELFKQLIDAPDIVSVPYKGAGPCITDLIAGNISMATVGVNGSLLELHRAGKIRLLAVTTSHRLKGAPEIPTAAEAGLPDLVADVFTALLFPAKTPQSIIDRVYRVSQKVTAEAAFQDTLIAQGFDPVPDSSPESALDLLKREISRWTPLMQRLGLAQR